MKGGDSRQRKHGATSDNESSSARLPFRETPHEDNSTPPSNHSTTSSIPRHAGDNTRVARFWPPFGTNDTSKCDRDEAKKNKRHQIQPELMCIIDDEEEEEEKQELAGSHIPKYEVSGLQQPHPGAFVVRGPDYIDSDQSTTGTVIVGEGNQNHQGRTSSIPNERITSQTLVVAAEVAPSEEDMIARMEEMERRAREHARQTEYEMERRVLEHARQTEYEMERRVRDQVQQVLQQTPRAEVVPVDPNIIIEHPSTSTLPPGEVEKVAISTDEVDETVQFETRNVTIPIAKMPPLKKWYEKKKKQYNDKSSRTSTSCTDKFKSRYCTENNLLSNHRRLVLLVLALVAIVVIVVSITVTQSSSNEQDDPQKDDPQQDDETKEQSEQRKALMSLYESTNGPNWDTDAQKNWGLPNVNECNWDGVTCTNGKVTDLGKWSDNLKGTIPTDVGLLTELTSLSFSTNELTGTLPSEMASMTKLALLSLYENELTGTIPTEMGRLTNMQWLFLDQNQLTGTLPSEIASMTKLGWLHVYNSNLESIPTEICDMNIPTFWGDCPPCSLECCTICY